MSSTEPDVRRFFERHLVPLADALRERGVRFFARGPEPDSESWYVAFSGDEPDFVAIDTGDLAGTLRDHWELQGLTELARLADPLAALSDELQDAAEETPDISPFVYVMY